MPMRLTINTSNEVEDIRQHIKKIQEFKISIPEKGQIKNAERMKSFATTNTSFKKNPTAVTPSN